MERPEFLGPTADTADVDGYGQWLAAHRLDPVAKHGGPGNHRTSGTPQMVHTSRGANAAKTRAAARSDAKTGKRTSGLSRSERQRHRAGVKARRPVDPEQRERELAATALTVGNRPSKRPKAAKKPKAGAKKPSSEGSGGKVTRNELADMAQQARRHKRTIDMASRRAGDPKADSARKKAESAVQDLEQRAKKGLPSDVTRRGSLIDWVAEMDRRRAIDLGAEGSS